MKSVGIDSLTGTIIGAVMEVHRTLGNGFQELIYQRALAVEMDLRGLPFHREMEMPIYTRRNRLEQGE